MAITETVPFNFEETYANVEQMFIDKGYDALYEGSNTAQLITAMSYLTSMLNVNTATNINETILSLANKRDNILQDARVLGYEISHISSYRYNIVLEFSSGNHTISKYSKFVLGDLSYYYMGNDINLVDVSEGYQHTIRIIEGNLKTFTEFPDLLKTTTVQILDNGSYIDQYYIDIPFMDVEDDGIEAYLTYYDEYANLHLSEEWTKSDQFLIDKDSILDRQFIRLDDIKHQTPRIYFKLANVGAGLRLGTIVEINVLISNGPDGALTGLPSTSLDCTPVSYELVTQGSAEETSESIKNNAPLFHNSANRAITKSDYMAICTKQQSVNEVSTWGGDDEYPKVPGHIWFSFLPSTLVRTFSNDEFKLNFTLNDSTDLVNWYIEDEEIRSTTLDEYGELINLGVWDVLDQYKVPTLIFKNRHPIYIDFDFTINIMKYSIKTSKSDIHQNMFDIINNYFLGINEEQKIETFESEYFHSNLEKRIDAGLTDITGFNNTLTTKMLLTSKTLVQEDDNKDNYDILIPLNIPFEKYFEADTGNLLFEKLPSIDTSDWNGGIYTDWSQLAGDEKSFDVIEADIKIGNDVVGKYTLFNSSIRSIHIHIFVKDSTGTPSGAYADSVLDITDLVPPSYLNLKYFSPNFDVPKNCIPRLNSVSFV